MYACTSILSISIKFYLDLHLHQPQSLMFYTKYPQSGIRDTPLRGGTPGRGTQLKSDKFDIDTIKVHAFDIDTWIRPLLY